MTQRRIHLLFMLLIGLTIGALTETAQAQVCSSIGQSLYCDSKEGSTIVAPMGRDRGVILGPGGTLDTYSVFPGGRLYIDRATRAESAPSASGVTNAPLGPLLTAPGSGLDLDTSERFPRRQSDGLDPLEMELEMDLLWGDD